MTTRRVRILLPLVLYLHGCGDAAPPPSRVKHEPEGEAPAVDKPAAPAPATPGAAAAGAKPGAAPAAAGAKPGAAPAAAGAKPGAAKSGKDKAMSTAERLIQEAHNRPFKPEDLIANQAFLTDPFHNNLGKFQPKTGIGSDGTCPLAKFNLEELKLNAIIMGTGDGTLAKAMFIDGQGVGHFLKRGDRVSKGCPVISRVLSDRVVFEFTEEVGPGVVRQVQRSVDLYPGETPAGTP